MNRELIKQIVSEAFDLEPGLRDEFVRKSCGDDPALLGEVLSLLDAASSAKREGFLPSDVDARQEEQTETVEQRESPAQTPEPAQPQQFGRYKVLERIGEGGMGIVYRAEQRVPIRREVVVKVIKLGMDTKLVIARFEAERQALAMMDHPHIAKVYDAGADDRGRPYFVMEYVKGTPIVEYCDRNRLAIRERMELFMQVCQAIQHAHHKGIIHRDIKPSNVLVSRQDGKPFAKVIDFGIAKATNQRLTDRTLFTEHVNMIGTPAYMSPEQADGNIDIDTRTDVYSLGVVLYELLTGYTPFDSRRLRSAALNEMARIIREEDPPRPSVRVVTINSAAGADGGAPDSEPQPAGSSLESLARSRRETPDGYVRSLRGEIDWMVMKALEKDRARRYETPNAIAEDIQRYLDGVAIIAAPPGWSYRAKKFIRQHKAALLAGTSVALLLLLGLAGTAVGLVQARHALAREKQATARESAAREDALMEAYIANISAAQIAMQGESWPEARQRLDACPTEKRGWEWNFLRAQSAAPEFGFAEPASHCWLSRSDRLLLCQNNLDFDVLDLQTRRRLWSYRTQMVPFGSQASYNPPGGDISVDGAVAVESEDSVVLLSPTGEISKKFKLERGDNAEHFVQFSPSGGCLLARRGARISVFSTGEEKPALSIEAGRGNSAANEVAWTEDDRTLALIDNIGAVEIYDLRSMSHLYNVMGEGADSMAATAVAFAPDGQTFAVAFSRGGVSNVRVFELATGAEIRALVNQPMSPQAIAFSPNGKLLLSIDGQRHSRVWEQPSGKLIAETGSQSLSPLSRFASDSARVLDPASGVIWDFRAGSNAAAIHRPAVYTAAQAISRDGKILVSIDNSRVHVWNTDQPSLHSIRFTSDANAKERGLACTTFQGRDIDLSEWTEPIADTLWVSFQKPTTIAMEDGGSASVDGHWTARPSGEHSIVVRDNPTGQQAVTLSNPEGKIRCVAFTRDGSRMVGGSDDSTIRFWDTGSWREVATLRQNLPVMALAFSEDDTRLIAMYLDKSIESLDIRDALRRRTDAAAQLAERQKVVGYVDSLLGGAAPWNNLAQTIARNEAMSPLARLAALDELHDRLAEIDKEAGDTFEALKSGNAVPQLMRERVAQMDLPRAKRRAIERLISAWNPDTRELLRSNWDVLATAGLNPERYAAAAAIVEQLAVSSPEGYHETRALAAARYRLGGYKDAVDLMRKAKALARKARQSQAVGATTSDQIAYGDENDCEAILSMALFKCGMTDEARVTLKRAMLGYGVLGDRRLSSQAAMLVNPAVLQTSFRPLAVSPALADGALDAQNLQELEPKVGTAVKIKGVVAFAAPTSAGGHISLFLQPFGAGVMLWVPHGSLDNFDPAFFADIAGCEVYVTGTLVHYVRAQYGWHGDMEIEVDSQSQITVVAPKTFVSVLNAMANGLPASPAAPASQPADPLAPPDVDANDQQKLIDLEDSKVRVHGTIAAVRLTAARNAAILKVGNAKTGLTVYVPPGVFPEFNSHYDGHPVDALTGHEATITGTVIDYTGAPEIRLAHVADLQVIAGPSTPPAP